MAAHTCSSDASDEGDDGVRQAGGVLATARAIAESQAALREAKAGLIKAERARDSLARECDALRRRERDLSYAALKLEGELASAHERLNDALVKRGSAVLLAHAPLSAAPRPRAPSAERARVRAHASALAALARALRQPHSRDEATELVRRAAELSDMIVAALAGAGFVTDPDSSPPARAADAATADDAWSGVLKGTWSGVADAPRAPATPARHRDAQAHAAVRQVALRAQSPQSELASGATAALRARAAARARGTPASAAVRPASTPRALGTRRALSAARDARGWDLEARQTPRGTHRASCAAWRPASASARRARRAAGDALLGRADGAGDGAGDGVRETGGDNDEDEGGSDTDGDDTAHLLRTERRARERQVEWAATDARQRARIAALERQCAALAREGEGEASASEASARALAELAEQAVGAERRAQKLDGTLHARAAELARVRRALADRDAELRSALRALALASRSPAWHARASNGFPPSPPPDPKSPPAWTAAPPEPHTQHTVTVNSVNSALARQHAVGRADARTRAAGGECGAQGRAEGAAARGARAGAASPPGACVRPGDLTARDLSWRTSPVGTCQHGALGGGGPADAPARGGASARARLSAARSSRPDEGSDELEALEALRRAERQIEREVGELEQALGQAARRLRAGAQR
ncbi:hypothetical protein KFE25_001326 [Diacronema lutheri]|uniref:Uncharacterized protein n=1 Tax=Diacronema lutheri TaxID=2081491 RepID=A0A8J6CBP8_DIALT|nr:hypothetical protein KFE25_001326 [Diacronema lutheri]